MQLSIIINDNSLAKEFDTLNSKRNSIFIKMYIFTFIYTTFSLSIFILQIRTARIKIKTVLTHHISYILFAFCTIILMIPT